MEGPKPISIGAFGCCAFTILGPVRLHIDALVVDLVIRLQAKLLIFFLEKGGQHWLQEKRVVRQGGTRCPLARRRSRRPKAAHRVV